MVAHACNPRTWRQRQENQESKVILGYTASSKRAWATRDPVLKKKKKRVHVFMIQYDKSDITVCRTQKVLFKLENATAGRPRKQLQKQNLDNLQ
ncbi:hypothetical protein I79_010803 [Cricetulus griseus]|uniref:Uncharacterized protein n=1 Tax=Cricetulus griseus TaxID=10029 RepID=G3HJF8_CRIGR|nr:hypothetical protein I79_010803 [Cricetulus griseus]